MLIFLSSILFCQKAVHIMDHERMSSGMRYCQLPAPLLSDPWMFGIFSILFCRNHPILKQVSDIKIMTENYQVGSLYFETSLQRVMMRNFGRYAPHYDMNICIWRYTWKRQLTSIPRGKKFSGIVKWPTFTEKRNCPDNILFRQNHPILNQVSIIQLMNKNC